MCGVLCCDSHSSCASVPPNKGERNARASAKSLAGEISASNKATTSATAGLSIRVVFSGCAQAMPKADRDDCIRPRRALVRAMTITSWGNTPALTCWATQRAACCASSAASLSSMMTLGVNKLSRHTSDAARLVCSGWLSDSNNGKANTRPCWVLAVLWALKSGDSEVWFATQPLDSMTALSACTTDSAFRRVWSQAKTSPPKASLTNAVAALNTRGSARRNL